MVLTYTITQSNVKLARKNMKRHTRKRIKCIQTKKTALSWDERNVMNNKIGVLGGETTHKGEL